MDTTEEKLKKIAALACIKMHTQSTQQLTKDVAAIMNFVDKLRLIDTHHITPLSHPLDLYQRLRADEVTEENQIHHLAPIAPLFADNHYLVPKVIDIGK